MFQECLLGEERIVDVPVHDYLPEAILNLLLIHTDIYNTKTSLQEQVRKELFCEVKWTLENINGGLEI